MSKSTRRDFIKKTAIATTGLTVGLSATSYANIIGANDRINVCFMGLGRRVSAYYPALKKQFNSRLSYLCDPKQSQVDKVLKNLKETISYKPKQEPDIRKVLEDKDVDAVFVATPDHWHALATCWALEAGKHVYVEKPCAHNPYEGHALIAAQKKFGKMVQMGNQQRSSAQTIEIIKDIHNGKIGTPYKAVAFYNNKRGKVPHPKKQAAPADLNWDLFQGPAPRQDYYHDTWNYNWHWYGWKWGTAETGNNATHELDIARWALQVDYPEFTSVNATKEHFKEDGWEMYDTMYATFKFPGNKTIHWDGKSRSGYNTYGGGRGTIIYGTEGTVFVDRGKHKLFDRNGKLVKEGNSKTVESGTALGGGGGTSTAHAVNFFEAIRGKAKLTSPISEGAISNYLPLIANIAYRVDKDLEIDAETGKIFDRDAMKLWGREYEPNWEVKMY